MDRHDALALLDVMRMQAAYAPPPVDEARLISAYLEVVSGSWEDTGRELAPWEIRTAAAFADLQFEDGRSPPRP